MKRLAIFIVVMFFCAASYAQNSKIKRYPFKSGIVEYKHSGKGTGKSTLYFDDYGLKEARYEEVITKVFGFQQKTSKVTIINGDAQYEYDLKTRKGTKMGSPLIMATKEEKDYDEWDEFSVDLMKSMGFEKTGQEKVQGKTCDVWSGMGKVWTWKGLSLKTEVNLMGQFLIEATSVKTNVSVPSSKFEVPDDVELVETFEDVDEETATNSQEEEKVESNNKDKSDNKKDKKSEEVNPQKEMKKAVDALKNLFGN